MLLVVIDQAYIRWRSDYQVMSRELDRPSIVGDDREGDVFPHRGELSYPSESVQTVALQELCGVLGWSAYATMLVTLIGLGLRLLGKVEVEVGRATCRSS